MDYPLLSQIQSPADFRAFSPAQLQALNDELRRAIIEVVSQREGHLGASLGVVELTVALHTVFETPHDRLIWDVGHQAYGHKMLTGRFHAFQNLRQWGGISGFPSRSESPFDAFGTGHSSTSLSALMGMAIAAENKGIDRQHIAVIGDASVASGMAFEALNHLGTTQANVLIVLNDNAMGIDPSVGALKDFFNQAAGTPQGKHHLFRPLNIAYTGPIDGHDLPLLLQTLAQEKEKKGPRLLHIRTTKGKGLSLAEKHQIQYHAPGKFDPLTGKINAPSQKGRTKYQTVVGESLQELFSQHEQLMAITPAMPTGSGLRALMQAFPQRCLDVGIAEQHAVTLAAGMAAEGLRPFCVLYATFLQRAMDQVIHDVALQQLPVVFLIDRAGLVGHDGATHHGLYDLPMLRSIPNLTVLSPRNAVELREQIGLLATSDLDGPVALRYPRGYIAPCDWQQPFQADLPLLTTQCIRKGKGERAVISVGSLGDTVAQALQSQESLSAVAHYDLGRVKPLDESALHALFSSHNKVVVAEEGPLMGGAGSAVLEWKNKHNYKDVSLHCIGFEDQFVPHASPRVLREKMAIDAPGIAQQLISFFTS